MKINEKWLDKAGEAVSRKSTEFKQVVLANKLHKELESKSLEQVLEDHLPISDTEKMKADAVDIQSAIAKMYDDTISDEDVEAHLNKLLDGHKRNEQGKLLVKLVNCMVAVEPDEFKETVRWQQLKNTELFRQEDIAELKAMVKDAVNICAEVMARKEFHVMESALEKLPESVLEAQMNSGKKYAEAYAAAIYIISKQNATKITPYEAGLVAVKSVEGCRLLAQYHYGKVRAEEVFPKLIEQAKKFLTIALIGLAAGVLRFGAAFVLSAITIKTLVLLEITSTFLLFFLPAGIWTMAVMNYSMDEAANDVCALWEGIKNFISEIYNFFKGNGPTPPPPPDDTNVVQVDYEIEELPFVTSANVTV